MAMREQLLPTPENKEGKDEKGERKDEEAEHSRVDDLKFDLCLF